MSIPAPARLLLDFIGDIEAPKGYDTVYGNNQDKLTKPLTSMTLDEVIAAQPGWTQRFGSSAAGRYQFMRATLRGLMTQYNIPGLTFLTPELQDHLGLQLLKRRGYADFIAGRISSVTFALRLAQEWASLPVLSSVRGGSRAVERGQSYYAGDGVNKALVSPERLERILAAVLAEASKTPSPPQPTEPTQEADEKPADEKPADPSSNLSWVGAAVLVAVFIIGAAIVALNLIPR